MKIIIQLHNNKYPELPQEDSVGTETGTYAVADGVTRDPNIPSDTVISSLEEALRYYPRPSGAKAVADIFTNVFLEHAKTQADLKAIFSLANEAIKKYNSEHIATVDYLVNDYFACVACGVRLRGELLEYGYIGDCGLAVYAADGTLRYMSEDGMATFVAYENKHLKKVDFNWNMASYRRLIRSEYRNKRVVHERDIIGYGALTGEEQALDFIAYGSIKLHPGDWCVIYSDGFRELLLMPEFFKAISSSKDALSFLKHLSHEKSIENYEKFGRERSLIAFQYGPKEREDTVEL